MFTVFASAAASEISYLLEKNSKKKAAPIKPRTEGLSRRKENIFCVLT